MAFDVAAGDLAGVGASLNGVPVQLGGALVVADLESLAIALPFTESAVVGVGGGDGRDGRGNGRRGTVRRSGGGSSAGRGDGNDGLLLKCLGGVGRGGRGGASSTLVAELPDVVVHDVDGQTTGVVTGARATLELGEGLGRHVDDRSRDTSLATVPDEERSLVEHKRLAVLLDDLDLLSTVLGGITDDPISSESDDSVGSEIIERLGIGQLAEGDSLVDTAGLAPVGGEGVTLAGVATKLTSEVVVDSSVSVVDGLHDTSLLLKGTGADDRRDERHQGDEDGRGQHFFYNES